jgi:hypothetical protein
VDRGVSALDPVDGSPGRHTPIRDGAQEMSEYQYYEFLAIDRPLDAKQIAQVRALSTRARISPTSFVNEYEWGDFRGNPRTLVERYYDAHLYFANWGTRTLMLRLPKTLLDLATAQRYCDTDASSAYVASGNVILVLRSEDEDGDEDWEDGGPGPLAPLIGVRAELAAGDLRPLYLAWLAALSAGEYGLLTDLDDDPTREPPVPAGLSQLTAAQQALAAFLRVDPDILAAAAEAGEAPSRRSRADPGLAARIKALPVKDKDAALLRLLSDDQPHARAELLRDLRPPNTDGSPQKDGRRTVGQLLKAADFRRSERAHAEERRRAEERQRREQKAAAAREQRLNDLALQGDRPWQEVDRLIATKKPRDYDTAVTLLTDLQTLSRRGGIPADFAHKLANLRALHQRKPALIERLDKSGLE